MAHKLTQNTKGIISIIGSCLLYLPVGSTYILGNINVYVSSYFKGVTSDETNIVFPITTIVGNIIAYISLPLIGFIGFRPLLLIATILTWAFIFASTFCTNFWIFFIFFGVGYGGTTGFLYLTLMYNGYKYFPLRRGLVGGILMGIYGLSSLISNFMLLGLMNPDNIAAIKDEAKNEFYFPDEIASRLPGALRILSYYFLGVMILGNFLQFEFKPESNNPTYPEVNVVHSDSDQKTQLLAKKSLKDSINREKIDKDIDMIEENGYKENSENDKKEQKERKRKNEWASSTSSFDENRCQSFPEAFRSVAVYQIMAMVYFSIQNGYFTATNFKAYGLSKISDDSFLTLVGSLSCVFNGGGRFFWGALSDKWNFKRVYFIILTIQIIEIATLRFVSEYKPLYLIWICVALLCEGGHFVIFPPLCLKVFGPQVGSRVFSVVLLVIACANMTQFGINLRIRPIIQYENEFYIYLGFSVVSWLLCVGTNIIFKKTSPSKI